MTSQNDAGMTDPDLLAIRTLLQESPDPSGASSPAEVSAPAPSLPERRRTPGVDVSKTTAETEALHARIRAAQAEADLVRAEDGETMDSPQTHAVCAGRIAGAAALVAARLKVYRLTRRHVAMAVLVVLALWRPWLLVAMVGLPMLIVAGIFAVVGHDRFWAGVLRGYRRLHARNPARAERLRSRADRFALRWDAVLDRFPDGTVDALYLPDLNSLQEAQAQHAQALDRRFTRLQQDARTQ